MVVRNAPTEAEKLRGLKKVRSSNFYSGYPFTKRMRTKFGKNRPRGKFKVVK